MPGSATAAKLTELEQAMAELAHAQAQGQRNLGRLETSLDRLAAEMRSGQARTEANLDRLAVEMRNSQARTEANLDRLAAEMAASKSEADERFTRMTREVLKANRAAGQAVNSAGRLVEDIVAPSIHDFFRRMTKWQGEVASAIRLRRPPHGRPGKAKEFDAFVAGGDSFLLLEVKSRIGGDRVKRFLQRMAVVRDFFPEAEGRKAYGAMASLYIDSSVVTAGERRGLLMVGLQSGLFTVLNSPGFKPAEF